MFWRLLTTTPLWLLVACSTASEGPCPGGGQLRGDAPPAGTVQWCEKDGVRHGPWKQWYADGSLESEGAYRAGKMSGEWIAYHDPTTLPAGSTAPVKREVGSYDAGVRAGVWTLFYASGAVNRESKYSNGAATVMWTTWHESGAKWAAGTSVHGAPHGAYNEWHANGQRSAQGSYDHGAKVGTWQFWDAEGNETAEPTATD